MEWLNRRGIYCTESGWRGKCNSWRKQRRVVDPWDQFPWRYFSKDYFKCKDTQTAKTEGERRPVLQQNREAESFYWHARGEKQSLLSQEF